MANRQRHQRPMSSTEASLMRQLTDDMNRLFDSLGDIEGGGGRAWPQIEVAERDGKLIVQADVPGMKREDVNIEIRDDALCISGDRRSEHASDEGGVYRSERSYGSFSRTIPLPEGAKPETATASFENGVLKVELETEGRGRH